MAMYENYQGVHVTFTMDQLMDIVSREAVARMVADTIYKEITENVELQGLVREGVKKAIDSMNIMEVAAHAVAIALKEQMQTSKVEPKDNVLDSYTCPLCNKTSYNPNDVLFKYCGNCHC